MSFKSTIVESIGTAAGKVMEGLDGLFTSDDERNQARVRIQDAFNALNATILSHLSEQEKERTERHKADMQSDSWLSKNIRPLSLIYLTSLFTFLAIADSLDNLLFTVAPEYIDLLKVLLVSVYGFYFVSRGVEKVTQAVKSMKQTQIEIK